MALGLRISDGTTTVDLHDGATAWALDYPIKTGALERANVSESAQVILLGGLAAARATIKAINKLLRQAVERRQNRALAKVYVETRPTNGENYWRSEILDAQPIPDDDALDMQLVSGKIVFDLNWERRNFWEGPEAQIPLSNPNGAGNTSGLTVHNPGSVAAPDNYVDISGAAVEGDLPAAARLELVNTTASAIDATNSTSMIWIGHNFTDPNGFTPFILDSSANVNINDAAEATVDTWSLTAGQLSAASGRPFKALVRLPNTTYNIAQTRFRLKLIWGGQTVWQQENQIIPDSTKGWIIRDIGLIRLPPWLPGVDSLDALGLHLTAQALPGASFSLGLDWMQLTPTDGWRTIKSVYSIPQNNRLIDDGIEGRLYQDNGGGTARIGNLVGGGKAIVLQPGLDQRLYFLQHSTLAWQAASDRTLSVKLYYRPRRWSL